MELRVYKGSAVLATVEIDEDETVVVAGGTDGSERDLAGFSVEDDEARVVVWNDAGDATTVFALPVGD